MNITITACLTFVLVGRYEPLNELAWVLATQFDELHITLLDYPTGWRCHVTCTDELYPQVLHLVQQRIDAGAPVQIVNPVPMPTRIYRAEHTPNA